MGIQDILSDLHAKKISPDEALKLINAISNQSKSILDKNLEKNYGLVLSSVHVMDELELLSWQISEPDQNEIQINVKASAINFPDIMSVNGLYPTMPLYPFVPGFEVAGVISKIGKNVTGFREGDEVIALAGEKMGGHANFVNVPHNNVISKPKNITFEQGCSLPVAFGTVYYAFEKGELSENEHVLIQTATGGCGLLAIQLARLRNCVCYGTSSRVEKQSFLKKINIPYVLNYKNTPFDEQIKALTSGRGVDVVLNMLSGDPIQRGLNSLAPFGRYLELAVHGLKTSPKLDLSKLIHNQSLLSIDLRRLSFEKGFNGKRVLSIMTEMISTGDIVPIVSRIYPLNQIKEAFEYVSSGDHIGKVVISHTLDKFKDETQSCFEFMLQQEKSAKESKVSRNFPKIITQSPLQNPEKASADIAIIGISGQFPQAPNIEEFWNNISKGHDCVSEIPQNRWDYREFYDSDIKIAGKSNCKWMGSIDDVDNFDPLFFNISPSEAEYMDPQQRLFLQNCWHCIEDAGYSPEKISASRCGVFVGCGTGDYGQFMNKNEMGAHGLMGIAVSILSARISYLLNLKGPCLAIDTACSSSLVAIATACDSLILQNSDLALAGGVYIMSGPSMHNSAGNSGMLSKDGKCFTFDDRANGFVPGEGVGVVLLKRLSDAQKDNDHIYGVIKGWGVNQDGKTNGITAPSVNSQIELETSIYKKFNINPETISYVEAHGTGTKLGDPIEVEALTESFKRFTHKKEYCALGSVKGNIGHLMTAAGVSGLIKLLLSMKNRYIPPHPNFEKINEHINLVDSPFYINTTGKYWENKEFNRRGVVSSFGFSGTNAHLVVEEYPESRSSKNKNVIFVLSAKTKEQLKIYAESFLKFLSKYPDTNLVDLAFTLQVGREAMEHRLAFVCENINDVIEKLSEFITLKLENYKENVPTKGKNKFLTEKKKDIDYTDLSSVIFNWLNGEKISWDQMYEGSYAHRISLPTYPFAKERYWLSSIEKKDVDSIIAKDKQVFKTIFSGEEFFLKDHVINGKLILPGVAYFEMILQAVMKATQKQFKNIKLHNIIWVYPFEFTNTAREIQISLSSNYTSFEANSFSNEGTTFSHCNGSIAFVDSQVGESVDISAVKLMCKGNTYKKKECYELFSRLGINYGSTFQGISELYCGNDSVLAKLELLNDSHMKGSIIPPSILDAALQSTVGLVINTQDAFNSIHTSGQLTVPYGLEEIQINKPCVSDGWVIVKRRKNSKNKIDVDICTNTGEICVRLKGYQAKILESNTNNFTSLLLKPNWKKVESLSNEVNLNDCDHYLFLVGQLNKHSRLIQNAYPNAKIISFEESNQSIDLNFIDVSSKLYEWIYSIIRNKPTRKVVFQILLEPSADSDIFLSLETILQSSQIENPKIVGHVIILDSISDLSILQQIRERKGKYKLINHHLSTFDWEQIPHLQNQTFSPWKEKGVYIIAGGAGGLGLLLATDMSEKLHFATIYMTGRSTLSADKIRMIQDLQSKGISIHYNTVDISNKAEVEIFISEILERHVSINGIIHCAGILQDNFIRNKSLDEFKYVISPKVEGLFNLDVCTKHIQLDFFIAFSSIASCWPTIGQIDYSLGNSFMDAYILRRHEQVLKQERFGKSLSINWPLWKMGGMQVSPSQIEEMYWLKGLRPLETENGISLFYQCMGSQQNQVAVLFGDKSQIDEYFGFKKDNSINVVAQIPSDLNAIVFSYIKSTLNQIIKIPLDKISLETPFDKYGIDSIVQLKLIGEFEKEFGELSKTLLFEYSTPNELIDYFIKEHRDHFETQNIDTIIKKDEFTENQFSKSNSSIKKDIAIIGVNGRYPKSDSLDELWDHLINAENCITSRNELDWEHVNFIKHVKDKKEKTRSGGFLKNIYTFDNQLFDISEENAIALSPEIRLMLEIVWGTFEDAGYTKKALQVEQENSQQGVGVFVGCMYNQYPWHFPTLDKALLNSTSGDWQIANHISHFFNLNGPSLAINTACSSSLTSIHLACTSLLNNECSMAIAGGVNITLNSSKFDSLKLVGFLDESQASRSFGKGEGYIPGEGVGAVLLKPLEQAKKDGDFIYGIIKGSSINHSGGRHKYGVPDPKQQAQLILQSFEKSGIKPETISYVESAANGSPLGDPIEMTALTNAFKKYTDDKQFCAIGSIKSNLGHLEAASGISQLTKVLLQFKYKTLVPTINAEPPNPHINFKNSPFYLQQKIAKWENKIDEFTQQKIPKRCLINSFGAGGSFANLIVEEYLQEASSISSVSDNEELLFIFSAKTKNSLMKYLKQIILQLKKNPDINLKDFADTLLLMNFDLDHRVALIASTHESLQTKLEAIIKEFNTNSSLGIYVSPTQNVDEYSLTDATDLKKIAINWIKGGEIPFSQKDQITRSKKIVIPKYQFDHEKQFYFGAKNEKLQNENNLIKELLEKMQSKKIDKESVLKILQGI
ncbi:MAG: SDR family NAD(P)-dependent oxidoreductase [Parachlamydiaceae bacterium]|nr:SDR family NAD(P)-dependent oxidoreductase [Parachlamydiaceae bacterium]